jgi:hypothetical protein
MLASSLRAPKHTSHSVNHPNAIWLEENSNIIVAEFGKIFALKHDYYRNTACGWWVDSGCLCSLFHINEKHQQMDQ